jgi:hypothetical protein
MTSPLPPTNDLTPEARIAALWKGGLILAGILAVAAGGLALFVRQQHGMAGVQSVGLAYGVCLIGALLAYAIAVFTVGTPNAMAGLMGGMLFRTGLPIVAGTVGVNTNRQLAEAGFMGHCMALFLVALVSEVALNVRLIKRAEKKTTSRESSSDAGKHIATVL